MSGQDKTGGKSELTDYRISVLLVDDQAIVGETVRRMVAQESDIIYNFCQDPTKAIQTAAEIMPTVILQDLVMPEVDGMTLVKFFRVHPKLKEVPIIVLSSKYEPEVKVEAFANGANDYFEKRFDIKGIEKELIARIRYHSKGYINLLQRNEAYEALLASQKTLAAELAQAADYVKSILPDPLTEGNILIDWRFIPSAQLGGDSFGYHWIDDEHFAMYLLDVCGHGVGSALLSTSAYHAVRSQTLPGVDFRKPDEVLCSLNNAFQMADHNNLYFTMWYGVYNITTGKLSYISAGHPPAVLFDSESKVHELMNSNFIVGGFEDFPFKSEEIEIKKPFTLYIFSDGAYEIALDEEKMWTIAEMIEFISNYPKDGGNVIDGLHSHCQKLYRQEILEDDFSMLKIDFL
ncbi:MAG: phosphoserine phosphatase RsbU/P [Bacteroidota bacterium]|nr:phosphoserine phosphatase RsbU/P [Bacteroidota bacterium]